MKNIKSIEENKEIFCEKTHKRVNIHSMTHPILRVKYSSVCDNAIECNITNCKYKGEDN